MGLGVDMDEKLIQEIYGNTCLKHDSCPKSIFRFIVDSALNAVNSKSLSSRS